MRRIVFGISALLAALVATARPGHAETIPGSSAPNGWTITFGAEGRVMPSFEGSDRYVLRPIPLIDIRRAGTPRRFSNERDGASIGILETDKFRVGASAKMVWERRESDDADLRGLGNVRWTLEAGVFAEYWIVPWLRTRVDVRQGFGGHHGVVADLSADVVARVTPQLTLSGGPRLLLASASALDPYFSINAVQSAASGLPVFQASGGVRSYGVGALARYEWNKQWATHFFMGYDRLTGDAARSPLVQLRGDPNQVQAGIGATYSFDILTGR